VAVRDRENAIFNLLRFYEARSAIVFCKTRMNVNNLLARMGNRGFKVVALSGELSQQERTHALQALRDGRARVCIATDVAARGIDLPGLDLVIHADLPSNSETLLHRSGRTGRAGSKGVSALIVPPAEFRKAQRLLQGAKVVAEWAAPPSADEVSAKDDLRLLDHAALHTPVGDDATMAAMILEQFGPEQAAAAFVRLWREGRSAPEVLSEASTQSGERSPPRERGEFGPSVWFRLSVGRSGRAEARWLLPKICDAGGITKAEIGAIRVQEDQTFVQIAASNAGKFGQGITLESGVEMTRMEGEPSMDRPERPAARPERKAPERKASDYKPAEPRREPRADKPAYVPKAPRMVDEDIAVPPAARTFDPAADGGMTDVRQRPARSDAPAKTYAPRPAGDRKPYAPRGDGPAKPYAKREDAPRKTYAPRAEGAAKPYAKREDGDRKPYAPRGDAAAKPYAPRGDGPSKPYAKREDAPRKAYAPRTEGDAEKKARWSPDQKAKPKAAGFKTHGGGTGADARPARSTGFKSHSDSGAPRSEGFKPKGPAGSKPYAARPKTAAPKPSASDTSKRFVPPRKPKA
jgi:ATP-dependent RNA helicase DeaD